MFILQPLYKDNKNEFIDLKHLLKDKTCTIDSIEKLLEFLTNTAKEYSLNECLLNISIDSSGKDILDLSKLNLSKCRDFQGFINNNNIKKYYFSNIDSLIPSNDKLLMFLSPNNTDYDYLCIDNVQLTQDTASNGTIFILPRGVYFKDLVINNSTLHKTNIHSSNYSINSNSVIIKDSTLYVTTSYGRVFGDFGQTLKELDISTSTFIPINYDGLFKSSYNNVDYVELGNLVSDDTYQFTNTQRGFQSSDTKVIKFNEFDTRYLTNINGLFKWCRNLESIQGLDDKDFSGVIEASEVLKECENLSNIPSSFNTFSSVKNLSSFFHTCRNIRYIQPKLNIGRVNLWAYIYSCTRLEIADLSKIVIDKSTNTEIEKINFHENFKFCDNLTDIHLGLMKCGLVFQMQQIQNSPNIRRVFIPKETNMGELNTDGWVTEDSGNKYGIFKYCSQDLVIYTDANYSFSKSSQTSSGSLPSNWLDKFNFISNNTGLEVIGNTDYSEFFTPQELVFDDVYNKYILKYRDTDKNIKAKANGLEILECYVSNENITNTNQFQSIIEGSLYQTIDFTTILTYYVNTNNQLNITFKLNVINKTYKSKGIILKVKKDKTSFTYLCFALQEISYTLPDVESPNGNVDDSGLGNITTTPELPSLGDTTGNVQVGNDSFTPNYGSSVSVDTNGNIWLVGNGNKVDFIANYESIKDYFTRNRRLEELKSITINGLCDIMVNMCKNALANHEFQKLIGYYLERSIKINNISFEVRNNKPILKNDIDSNITNVISEEKVRLFINAFNSLKEKYNDLTSSTFETDYESMQFTIYDISSDKTKEYVYQGKLFGLYNYIHGEIYKEGLELVKHKLQQKYSFNFWFL